MQWMSYPLDIVFIDKSDTVVALYHGLRPWRFSKTHREAVAAIELPVGTVAESHTEIGDRLSQQELAAAAA